MSGYDFFHNFGGSTADGKDAVIAKQSFNRIADAQDTDISGFSIKRTGKFVQFLPIFDMGNYFFVYKFFHRTPDHFMGDLSS